MEVQERELSEALNRAFFYKRVIRRFQCDRVPADVRTGGRINNKKNEETPHLPKEATTSHRLFLLFTLLKQSLVSIPFARLSTKVTHIYLTRPSYFGSESNLSIHFTFGR